MAYDQQLADAISEITALRSKLESARKVIEHYGSGSNWECDNPFHGRQPHEDGCFDVYNGGQCNGQAVARKWLEENTEGE
jgi:hypothetical protein